MANETKISQTKIETTETLAATLDLSALEGTSVMFRSAGHLFVIPADFYADLIIHPTSANP